MILDDEDEGLEASFKDLLAFYGVELQSHASIVIGLAVVIFAVVQAWGQLVSALGSATAGSQQSATLGYGSWIFSCVVGGLGLLIVYQVLRLIVFGKLASSLISCSSPEFRWHKQNYLKGVERQKMRKSNEAKSRPLEWDEMSDFRKINVYSSGALKLGLRKFLKAGIFVLTEGDPTDARHSFWIQGMGFALTFSLSYNFLFGRFEWVLLIEQLVGSFVILDVLRFPKPPSFDDWRNGWKAMWRMTQGRFENVAKRRKASIVKAFR